ncbi:MAG TPA: carbon-nitrogen hydrolase family protein [Ktedonobacterales bacterium]|nr:carbon-nitrogen hydrolase family protein [Ktedonobacterales bacterium]
MGTLHIALLQMTSCGNDQQANLLKGEGYCRRASALGADIALFPEMWNIGYTPWSDGLFDAACDLWKAPELWGQDDAQEETPEERQAREAWQAQAVERDSPFVAHFRALARELNMAIGLTYLERWPGAPRNSMSLIDRHGQIALTYAKVHTCDFGPMEAACTEGDDFFVCALDTAQGPVRVGAMICYDREFPESARVLMLKGAEIILIPNACEMEANRTGQLRARAAENMVGVALANYAAPQENGHSVAYGPIAFDKQGRSRNTLVVEAGEGEGIYLAPFDLEELRDYRMREAWGNAFRRPHRYSLLTSSEAQPPFIRVNARGERYNQRQK